MIFFYCLGISPGLYADDFFSCLGTSPGLYTDDEIQSIVSHMMPGGVQTKRVDKIEQAFERFLKKVRHNLHVIVCLNSKGK